MSSASSPLKQRLRTDLTAAIKGRDKVRSGTIRMVLTAITNAEVAGKQQRELSGREFAHRGNVAIPGLELKHDALAVDLTPPRNGTDRAADRRCGEMTDFHVHADADKARWQI